MKLEIYESLKKVYPSLEQNNKNNINNKIYKNALISLDKKPWLWCSTLIVFKSILPPNYSYTFMRYKSVSQGFLNMDF